MTAASSNTPEEVLVELDPRRRTTLRLGHHERYLAHEEPDGTLIFRPAVIMTTDEAALRGNPDLVDRMDRSLRDPSVRTRRARPTVKE